MIWYGYFLIPIFLLLAVSAWVFKTIKRRNTQTLVDQKSTKEIAVQSSTTSSRNSESLNPDQAQNSEMLCQSDENNETSEVLCNDVTNKDLSISNTESRPSLKNTEDILNATCNTFTTDDVPELLSKFIVTNHNLDKVNRDNILGVNTSLVEYVKDTINIKSDTVCSGNSSTEDEMYKSIIYTTAQNDLDTSKFNSKSQSSTDSWDSCNKEISNFESDDINCVSSDNSETETIQKPKTFFTERRKRKSLTDSQNMNFEKHLCAEMIEDDESILNAWNTLKKEFNFLNNNREHSSLSYEKLEKELDIENIERSLNNDKLDYDLENTKHSLNDDGQVLENDLETTGIPSMSHNELENVEDFLNDDGPNLENYLETTRVSSMRDSELENEYSLESPKLAYFNYDRKLENDLQTTGISCIYHVDLENEDSLEDLEHSLNDDGLKHEFDLDTTGNNKLTHDYEIQGNTELNSTSSSEYSESMPSTIHSNDNSIDDIQFVEDYNDISFFDSNLEDEMKDAMNEAFVED